jgi:hypothetical protein
VKKKMATNATKTTTTKAQTNAKASRQPTGATGERSDTTTIREGLTKARRGTASYLRHSTERAVDVPVGAVLRASDRVNDVVVPWTAESTRERELRSMRQRVERELRAIERRGGSARRKATLRARRTRRGLEREIKARRRSAETTMRQNRRKAETQIRRNRKRAEGGIKRAQSAVSERVSELV